MVTETKSRGSVSRFASLSTLKREKCETSYEKRNFSRKSQDPFLTLSESENRYSSGFA